MTSLRIAIASDWFAPRRGGIEGHLAQLARRLVARGHQVDVLTTTPGPPDGDGARIVRLPGLRLPHVGVSLSPRLPGALRREMTGRYDVVHAHISVVSPVAWSAVWAARSLGVPVVATFHSVLHLKRRLLAAVNALTGLGGRQVIWSAVSVLVASQVRQALGHPVRHLPNGFERADWPPVPAPRAAGPPTIIAVGRLHAKKRMRALVASFADAAARTGSPARLVICGDGPERGAIERVIRRRGLDRGPVTVTVTGWQDAATVHGRFAESDAFALASRNEAFGIAALEARAAGLPVLAMRVAGCAEFLDGDPGGVLCDGDADMIAAIERVLRDPARLRVGSAGSRLAPYEWDAVLRAHEASYGDAISLSRGATAAR